MLCFAFRRGKFPYFKTAPDGWKVSVNVVIESILRMTGTVPVKFEFKNIRSSYSNGSRSTQHFLGILMEISAQIFSSLH